MALLSVGEEPNKGTPDVVQAHAKLAESGGALNFIGNVEGSDVTRGAADVIVTDGFTGNVALKLMEGTVATVVGAIREAARSGPVSMLGGLLIRGAVGGLRSELDPNTTGGAILLGVRGVGGDRARGLLRGGDRQRGAARPEVARRAGSGAHDRRARGGRRDAIRTHCYGRRR